MAEMYRRKKDLPEQVMGEELMVFDADSDKVHVLNKTSAFIWSCLGDDLDEEAIKQRLEKSFDLSTVQDVPEVIRTALRQLAEKGLVEKA
jgi:PqqD family protein of HPr-rel-A system